jgi:hypothetical protein
LLTCFFFLYGKIKFFVKLLHEEPREKLQLFLLGNLQILAARVSHLWTSESLASFVAYIESQRHSETLLVRSSRILVTLARNANAFFLFVFEEQAAASDACAATRFEHLLESMLFHSSRDVAFNFNSLATTLLVMHAQNRSVAFLDRLFESTKTGLFALILECDRECAETADAAAAAATKSLKICQQHLKVG